MKKSKKIVLFVSLFLIVLISLFTVNKFLKPKKKTTKDLINISKLSKEFMDNYFDEMKEINSSENQDNILIIISESKITESYGATKIVEAPNNQYVLLYNSEVDKNNALEKFKKDDSILSVEENTYVQLDETYNSWGITKMSLDYAKQNVESRNLNDVVVAIIDTGLNVDLANQYYDGKIADTYNFVGQTDVMSDENGHGTHVFGTIAEGTPSNVKIFPMKIGTTSGLSITAIVSAINYVAYNECADVINMSFGGGYSKAEEQAIAAANEKNIISVAAAGNDNTSANHYPSALETTISISSVDSSLNKSYFSNYGDTVDFAAPGSNIKSINGIKSGTSMATPHAVSAVAILKSYNKNLTIENVRELLKKHAIDLGEEGKDKYFGYGFITFLNAKFCEGDNDTCDEYGVYKTEDQTKLTITKIEPSASGGYYIPYNYNNITSLMNSSIKIYYSDDTYIIKRLGDLEDLVITNYDPSILYNIDTGEGKQTITIKYRDLTTTAVVMNSYSSNSDWQYEKIDDNNIKLTGINYGNISSYFPKTIYIPENIDGYTVTELGESLFKGKTQLIRVFLPNSITTISNSVFENCYYLSNIVLSNNIQIIGDSAFKNTNLETIDFNNSLVSIGEHAFENTTLTTVKIPKNVNHIGYYAFAGCNNITSIVVDSENTTYDSIDESNMIIETKTNTLIKGYHNKAIPNTVKIIGEGAYYGDNRLYSVTIPEGVTTIDYYAFRTGTNSSLMSILIPKSVTTIQNAFNANDKNVTITTYSDAYAKTYAILNKIKYVIRDFSSITSFLEKNQYEALSTVNGNIRVVGNYEQGYYNNDEYISGATRQVIIFDDDVSKLSSEGLTLLYPDNRSNLIFGDTYIIIKGKDSYSNSFETHASVSVSKITPEYTIPTNVKALLGQTLSEISLPSGFEWMDGSQLLTQTGEVTYKAKYIPEDSLNYETIENIDIVVNVIEGKYTIKYNSNDGSGTMPNQVATYNQDVSLNQNIFVKTGYKFTGWNTASDGSGETYTDKQTVRNITNVNEEITLYAQWNPIKYTVKFNANSGSGEMENQIITYDQSINLSENTFTKKGYNFVNWNTKADGSGETYTDKKTVKNLLNVEGEITLYAQWSPITYTIKYNSNNATGTMNDQTATYNQNVSISKNTFMKTGYKFTEWNTKVDGSGQTYTDEQSVTITENLTLYAQWTPIRYTIKFNSNSGSGTMNDLVVEYDQEVTLTKNTFEKQYYNFKGWSTTIDGEPSYTNEQKVSNLTNEDGKVITLYAVWQEMDKHTVTFNSNFETNTTKTQSVYDNISSNLNKNTFTRTGYKFTGWNTASDGSGDTYTDEQNVTLTQNMALYAQWSPIKYTIKFNSNSGSGTMNDLVVEYDKEVTLTKNTFKKDGFRFIGWSTIIDGEVVYTNTQKIKNITTEEKIINLYAKWEEVDFNINDYVVGVDTLTEISEETTLEDYLTKFEVGVGYRIDVYKSETKLTNEDLIGTGSIVKIYKNDNLLFQYTNIVYGDVTGDGIVNIADVIKIADHTVTKNILNEIEMKAAEVTHDDVLTISDVIKIADHTVDKNIKL